MPRRRDTQLRFFGEFFAIFVQTFLVGRLGVIVAGQLHGFFGPEDGSLRFVLLGQQGRRFVAEPSQECFLGGIEFHDAGDVFDGFLVAAFLLQVSRPQLQSGEKVALCARCIV